jgi:hypothetical protein
MIFSFLRPLFTPFFQGFQNLTFSTSMGIPEPRGGKDHLNLREQIFLACLRSNDFARVLVFPDSEKDRMPKTIISGRTL